MTTELRQQALMLMQAMLGAITPNFRMISINVLGDTVRVQIVLEYENVADREEIEDCQTEFEALQLQGIEYEFEVIVSSDELIMSPNEETIYVYRRKEY